MFCEGQGLSIGPKIPSQVGAIRVCDLRGAWNLSHRSFWIDVKLANGQKLHKITKKEWGEGKKQIIIKKIEQTIKRILFPEHFSHVKLSVLRDRHVL
jgi:hypothetical protein